MHKVTIQAIDDVLPQTQCGQCGYKGCLPYAQAIFSEQAPINRCPPGGDNGIAALANLLGLPMVALDTTCGIHKPRFIADIAPEHCIGCTLCIKACPVDAIVGGNKKRHAVIAALCTGCELCIPPCPVDCINMTRVPEHSQWNSELALEARERMHTRERRLQRVKTEKNDRLEAKALQKLNDLPNLVPNEQDQLKKRSAIEAALARARARRELQKPTS